MRGLPLLRARALAGAAYGVDASDPVTFLAAALTSRAAAFVACVVPALRAASVDPVLALRRE